MFRQTADALRNFLDLFRDCPPLHRRVLVPGAVAVVAFVVLALWFGPGAESEAFITAFAMGFALRMTLRARGMLYRLLERFTLRETLVVIFPIVLMPVMLVIWIDNPLWCQRLQSLYHIVLGAMFLSDVMGHRSEMAALYWPWDTMSPYLPALTRMMVLFHLTFLLLNETLIQVLLPSGWLVFWGVLPVITHLVLSALIVTVVAAVKNDAAQG